MSNRKTQQANEKGETRGEIMDLFAYDQHLTDREIGILKDLLEYRVLTTEMIEKRHFEKKGNYVNVVLTKLRKDGYIRSNILRRSRKGRKGYAYHSLTETGKECLIRHGVSVEDRSKNIYFHEYQVPNLLLANEVLVEYKCIGWEAWDSRKTKSIYNLDYRSNIQGMLISPNGERYGLYALETSVTENVIGKIQSEIMKHQKFIKDYMILAKGMESYKLFIEYGMKEDRNMRKRKLQTMGKLVIEPFKMNFVKRKTFKTEFEWIRKLCDHIGCRIISTEIKEDQRQSFPIVVEYRGEEMYFVDLTDSDLNKYYALKVYNDSLSSRKWEKRRILAVSLSIRTRINEIIKTLPVVNLMLLEGNEFMTICNGDNQ